MYRKSDRARWRQIETERERERERKEREEAKGKETIFINLFIYEFFHLFIYLSIYFFILRLIILVLSYQCGTWNQIQQNSKDFMLLERYILISYFILFYFIFETSIIFHQFFKLIFNLFCKFNFVFFIFLFCFLLNNYFMHIDYYS